MTRQKGDIWKCDVRATEQGKILACLNKSIIWLQKNMDHFWGLDRWGHINVYGEQKNLLGSLYYPFCKALKIKSILNEK